MYQYHEYFDQSKKGEPYSSPGEELEDFMRLLDMMLESYLEYKGMGSQRKLFSRGLVITESEMENFFSMPPYFRERDIWDPVLSSAADAAFGYIMERCQATDAFYKDSTLPDHNGFRFSALVNEFALSRAEIVAVILALAPEIDRRYERIFGFLQDDISRGAPSFGLLNALMGRITPRDGAEETLPLPLNDKMYTYFFIRKEGAEGLSAPLVLHPLMKKILIGYKDFSSKSSVFRRYMENEDIPLFFKDSYKELSYIISSEKKEPTEADSRSFAGRAVYIGNEDPDTVLHLVYRFCAEHREEMYVLDLHQLLSMQAEKQQLALSELLIRLRIFNGRLALLYLPDEDESPVRPSVHADEVSKVMGALSSACSPRILFIYGQKEEPGELASMFIPFLRVPESPVTLRTDIWEYFLTGDKAVKIADDVNIPDLADCYEIPYGKVQKVAGHAVATAKLRKNAVIDRPLILESLRQMNRVDFSGLATFVKLAYTWDDITITESQLEIMKTACDRYRLRNRIGEGWGLKRRNAYGNGVSILLYGPPGTGKTMAAQVIANELSLPLYRVDISQISSKYIGETEKNLAVIFNAAAKANVILFFDEADALFSKRTSVGDSHDKYANSETAYLLQKIEEYDGMSILSTNYYNNFDDAFVRRITYSVHMEQPDKTTRYTLWTTILPKKAKLSKSIDFKWLADKFELSGSNIKAILYNAAYMAGAEGKMIGMKHIIRALEYEFNKLGKLVNSSEFGKYEIYLQNTGEKAAADKKADKK